ncbi:MAG: alpha/beta fold hydrolase [Thermoanaerobaculia bacterium]|nr:alpha/beta fold hydrolase [Thermoanaerobaculia bacterium]
MRSNPGFSLRLRGLACGAFWFLIATLARAESPLAGHWEGQIEIPASPLVFKVDFVETAGVVTGTLDIPIQGLKAHPLGEISLDPTKVRFKLMGIPGDPTFEGRLGEDGQLRGYLQQGGMAFPFRLGREAVAGPARPQEPKPPFPYMERDWRVTSGEATLAGTLTLPPGDGPFPAVVLISGSGAQDRDETLMGHRPFAVWADHLTRAGIAVLRLDDRGVGGSTGGPVDAHTTETFAGDALAAVSSLHAEPKIDAKRIGLVGHSEGGVVAPLAASRSQDVAFVVLLAGTGVTGEEIVGLQIAKLATAAGVPAATAELQAAGFRRVLAKVVAGAPEVEIRAGLRAAFEQQWAPAKLSEERMEESIRAALGVYRTPWFRFFLAHDPRPALRQLKVPVLALNGELDAQVDADQNLPEIEKALREAANPDVTLRRLPGLNHLFQTAKTGALTEYAQIEETVAPEVLELVTEWIRVRFGERPAKGTS